MNRRFVITAGIGCSLLLLLLVVAVALFFLPFQIFRTTEVAGVQEELEPVATLVPGFAVTQEAIPTLNAS